MWAIIGGSGFEKFDGFEPIENLKRETPFGLASSGIKKVKIASHEFLFISRHGERHELLPSKVNYRANIYALKSYGAQAILSFSAVGSLQEAYKPGDMVVPYQYIDRTKSLRQHTFCDEGLVGHMSLAHPVCKSLAERVRELSHAMSWDSHFAQTYVCIEGPNFSTKAESQYYRDLGADIVGMTHFPEYALAREAGLSYLPCCFVTDYDCWDESRPHVTLEEVIQVMRNNNAKAFELTQKILAQGADIYADCECSQQGLKTGLMTPREQVPAAAQEWLKVLLT